MYYRARWYDPSLGKFLNDDPMGFAAGDVNVSRYVGNTVVSVGDATGLFGDPSEHPLWGYRQAALLKQLPVSIIDDIIRSDPSHSVAVVPTNSSATYSVFWNDIRIPKIDMEIPPSDWRVEHWSQFYNELWHAWWDLHIAVGKPNHIYTTYVAQYTTRYTDLPKPFVAQEEAYSETVARYIMLQYRMNNLDDEIDFTDMTPGHILMPVSHAGTFGNIAESRFVTEQEYKRLIIPVLNGTIGK